MSINRYDPWRNFSLDFPWFRERDRFSSPRVDIHQTDQNVIATAELPGLTAKEDMEITVTENTLTLRGEIKRGQERQDEHYYHTERYFGSFERHLSLPVEIEPEKTTATYHHGILEITMPKAPHQRHHRVRVDIH
jgi:HSP20 family protein